MWDRLRKQVTVERQQLHRLLETYRPLFEKCAVSAPNDIEIYALAGLLHSFYNGIENIFKRIAEELDGQSPRSQFWHRELLDSMSQPREVRPAVISESLVERLDSYLDFRHFFRHSYIFDVPRVGPGRRWTTTPPSSPQLSARQPSWASRTEVSARAAMRGCSSDNARTAVSGTQRAITDF